VRVVRNFMRENARASEAFLVRQRRQHQNAQVKHHRPIFNVKQVMRDALFDYSASPVSQRRPLICAQPATPGFYHMTRAA